MRTPERREWLAGSVTVLLGIAAMVIVQWPQRGFWYDETVNAYFAGRSLSAIWEWCTRIDNQMPLDYVLRMGWARLAGTGEFALRAYSLGWALVSVAGVMALGRRLSGTAAGGWIAATLYAVSQSLLYAAFEVRPYALALALFAWASVVLWDLWWDYGEGRRRPDRRLVRLLLGYWLLAIGVVYTHYTGFVALAAHGIFLGGAALQRRSRRLLAGIGVLATGLALGYLPWVIALAGRDVRAGTAYADQIAPLTALKTYLEFYVYGQRSVPADAPPYALAAGLALAAGAGLGVLGCWRRSARCERISYALVLMTVPLAGLLALVYGVQGKLSGRHGWPAWIGAAVLIGAVIGARQFPRGWRGLVAAGMAILLALPARAHYPPTYNSYLREAFAYVNTHREPGDVLVLRDGTLFAAAHYYEARLPWIGLPPDLLTDVNRFLFFEEASRALDALVTEHTARRVWVIAWQGQIMDPQDLVDGLLEAIGQPQPLPGAFGFGDVSVALYALYDPPAALRARVGALMPLAQTPGGGPIFLGGYLLDERPVPRGGAVVIHTWWQRGGVVMPEMRISARLYAADGTFYAQHDQPPAGPAFGQEHWPPGMPIFSRLVLAVPPEMPPGDAEVRLVIYHMANAFEPFSVPVASLRVE